MAHEPKASASDLLSSGDPQSPAKVGSILRGMVRYSCGTMLVVSAPDGEGICRTTDHLWLLVGEGILCDGNTAHYLGPDRYEDGSDLASVELELVAHARGLDVVAARRALERYRLRA